MSTNPPGTNNSAEAGDDSTALFAELDALLERMLALPVSTREEFEEPAGHTEMAPPRDLPPLITIAEAMPEPVQPCSTPAPPVSFVDESLQPQPSLDLSPFSPSFALEKPLPPAFSQPSEALEAKTSQAPTPSPSAPLPTEEQGSLLLPPLPLWERPLVWFNRAFDRCTARLGIPGRWLRAPATRSLMGWMGLLLLAVVCGVAVHDWFGWTW